MKVGLFLGGHSMLTDLTDMFRVRLAMRGVDVPASKDYCLCQRPDLEGLDVVVAHPCDFRNEDGHWDNQDGCWGKMREVVEANPARLFYIFAFNNSGREYFFGKQPNVICLSKIDEPVLENPAKAVFEDLERFRRDGHVSPY